MSQLVGTVLFVLQLAVLGTTLYAFVHAAMQRTDAYTAAEKLTKPVWLVILGAAGLLSLVLGIGAGGSPYEGGYTSMAHGWSTGTADARSRRP